MKSAHIERINQELKASGAMRFGVFKPEAQHIAPLIHDDEHIGGAIYGQTRDGEMAYLIATNKRVIFYDRKPFYSTFDEFTYDVVAGVKMNRAGISAAVVLHSRIRDYSLRFVNIKRAKIFVKYIEDKLLSGAADNKLLNTPKELQVKPQPQSNKQALEFLGQNNLAVLSTVDRTGNVHGAVVNYYVDQANFVYIVTKSGTSKGRNVYANGQVALTVYKAGSQQTLQMQGVAQVETDQAVKDNAMAEIMKIRASHNDYSLPPVTKLHNGAFMVIKIAPTQLKFHDYSKLD